MDEESEKTGSDLYPGNNRNDLLGLGKAGNSDSKEDQFRSPHFFSMAHLPSFGKNWLDHFIPNEDMQNIYLTSEVVRNVVMLQSLYVAKTYRDLLKIKCHYNK
jgi:hypothetical protein